jgi:outer membrane protein assembly factor BamB
MVKRKRTLLNRASLLLVILLVVGIAILGCARTGAIPRGWTGGAIADGTLFLGSMEGELIAVDVSDGGRLWEPVVLETMPSGGFSFGCTPSATAVAIYGDLAVAGDLFYVGGYDGKIYAFNTASGALRWVYPRQGELLPIVGGPVVALDKVYIGNSDGNLYALDAATGDYQWQFTSDDKIWSTPAIADGTVYIASFDKKLYALDATDGDKKWSFEAEGTIVAPPVIANNTVYIGSFDRYFYAVDAADGSLNWKFLAENWFWARAAVYGDTIYAASLDGKVYALDAASGDKLAEIDLGKIYSIDTANNSKRELIDLDLRVNSPLSASRGVVYVHTQEKEALYALNVQTGVLLWTLPLTGE